VRRKTRTASPNSKKCTVVTVFLAGVVSFCCFWAPLTRSPAASDRSSPGTAQPVRRVTVELCEAMKASNVLRPQGSVSCDRLRLVQFSYIDFKGNFHDNGALVVLDAVADSVVNIFASLRKLGFPIRKGELLNRYGGDDNASMADDNTSSFNDRVISNGSSRSLHAYGVAIDINPVENPFIAITDEKVTVSPPTGTEFLNRLNDRPFRDRRPGMAEAVVDIFANNGFLIWGGYWDNPIDYQHFDVGRNWAERLVALSPAEAKASFIRMVGSYRDCRRSMGRSECIEKVHGPTTLNAIRP
jgi:D-alanyl-D-alanine carboxypeptidase-like protein